MEAQPGLYFKIIILTATSILANSPQEDVQQSNKLLLLMYDGMRWDSVRDMLPGMKLMMDNGVHAHHLIPCFPTSSLSNHFSILTGLYPESHGLLDNTVYDVKLNKTLSMKGMVNDHSPTWWTNVKPIWQVAVEQGKRVKVYHWVECGLTLNGFHLNKSQCEKFERNLTTKNLDDSVNDALNRLAQDELDFAAIYHFNPDHVQHFAGINSETARMVINDLDQVVLHLQEKSLDLKMSDGKTSLSEKLNVMLVSDHGHNNIRENGAINLTSVFVKYPVIHLVEGSTRIGVWPLDDGDEIFQELSKLSSMSVYRRDDIPERWHYKNGRFAPQILCVADRGFYFISPGNPGLAYSEEYMRYQQSLHGYDNRLLEMQAVFLARGPNFKRRFRSPSIENIQLYQIMCSILGIKPFVHNGTWPMIQPFVVNLSPFSTVSKEAKTVSFKSLTITVVI